MSKPSSPFIRPQAEEPARRPANAAAAGVCELHYRRGRNREVDFVIRPGGKPVALEVESGRRRDGLPGMAAFLNAFHPTRRLLVGGDGIDLGDFLLKPIEYRFET